MLQSKQIQLIALKRHPSEEITYYDDEVSHLNNVIKFYYIIELFYS